MRLSISAVPLGTGTLPTNSPHTRPAKPVTHPGLAERDPAHDDHALAITCQLCPFSQTCICFLSGRAGSGGRDDLFSCDRSSVKCYLGVFVSRACVEQIEMRSGFRESGPTGATCRVATEMEASLRVPLGGSSCSIRMRTAKMRAHINEALSTSEIQEVS